MIYSVLKFISFVLSKFFFGIKINGRENLPATGGFIIAANHLSYLDPVILGCVVPRKVCYMAKEELFRSRFMAWLLENLWVFPVKRQSADLAAIKEAMRRLRAGIPMLMFPQGARAVGNEEVTPLAGVGFLAAKLKLPVVPAFIEGTDKAMPPGKKIFRLSRVRISFGEPIIINKSLSYEEIAADIMSAIKNVGKKLQNS